MPMSPDEVTKYKTLYIKTAKDYLNTIEAQLYLLLDDRPTNETAAIIHRSAHSLAGQSAVIGYKYIAQTASLIERIFKAHIDGTGELKKETLQRISEAVQHMRSSVDEIEKGGEEKDLSGISFSNLQNL